MLTGKLSICTIKICILYMYIICLNSEYLFGVKKMYVFTPLMNNKSKVEYRKNSITEYYHVG